MGRASLQDFQIDLSSVQELEQTPVKIRIKRNTKTPAKPQEPTSKEIKELTNPKKKLSKTEEERLYLFEAKVTEKLKHENPEEVIRTIDWGGFDPEKLVFVLYTLAEMFAGGKIFPYQEVYLKRIFRSVLLNDGDRITYLVSRQGGKTFTTAMAVATLCGIMPSLVDQFPEQLGHFSKGFWVGIYAPVDEQTVKMFDEIKVAARSQQAYDILSDPEIDNEMETYGLRWRRGSYVHTQSANKRSSVESKTFHLLICDESQGLDEKVVDDKLLPMIAWNNGTMVMLGTPTEEVCYFYNVIQKNKDLDFSVTPEKKRHFEFNYSEVIKYNDKYRRHVDSVIRDHGEESRMFRKSYKLHWLFEESRVIKVEELKEYAMHIPCDIRPYSSNPVVAGIDLARKRNSTVVAVAEVVNIELRDPEEDYVREVKGHKLLGFLELQNMKYPEQRATIYKYFTRFPNLRKVVLDSTGAGDVFFDEIQDEWELADIVEPYVFSPRSKAVLTDLFFELLYQRRLMIPNTDRARADYYWQKFFNQLKQLVMKTANGYSFLVKPDKNDAFDDFPDAYFLSIWASNNLPASGVLELASWINHRNTTVAPKNMGLDEARAFYRAGGNSNVQNLRESRNKKLLRGIV